MGRGAGAPDRSGPGFPTTGRADWQQLGAQCSVLIIPRLGPQPEFPDNRKSLLHYPILRTSKYRTVVIVVDVSCSRTVPYIQNAGLFYHPRAGKKMLASGLCTSYYLEREVQVLYWTWVTGKAWGQDVPVSV